MSIHHLESEVKVSNSREEVFEFFNQPKNLSRLMPSNFKFQILTPGPIRMQSGTVLDYRFSFGLMSLRWTSLITDYKPPFRFTDVQIRGPFSFWNHTHEFFQIPEGTLIVDTLSYEIGWGFVGEATNSLMVKKSLRRMFDYRQKIITQQFKAL